MICHPKREREREKNNLIIRQIKETMDNHIHTSTCKAK